MKKNKILMIITGVLSILAIIFPTIWFMTGDTLGDYFIGHVMEEINDEHPAFPGDGWLLIGLAITIISMIMLAIACIISFKGKNKEENKPFSKAIRFIMIGATIVMIAVFVLMTMRPGAENGIVDDSAPKTSLILILVGVGVVGAILSIVGIIQTAIFKEVPQTTDWEELNEEQF